MIRHMKKILLIIALTVPVSCGPASPDAPKTVMETTLVREGVADIDDQILLIDAEHALGRAFTFKKRIVCGGIVRTELPPKKRFTMFLREADPVRQHPPVRL